MNRILLSKLKNNATISFDDCPDIDFMISKEIGRGASCIVYHAVGSNNTEHLLKEYYPKHLELSRDDSGHIVVPEDKKELFDQGLVRFRAGCDRQKRIRLFNEDLKNFTCNVQGYYAANGTQYIDMTCFNGRTYDHVQEKSVYNLMLRMRTLAQVIGNYHKAGLLHLDIKPENIYVRPEGETIEDVMLFDFDSVTPKNEIMSSRALSCTKTWAAPEQLLPERRKSICPATDLFAIGEIIFVQLFGRHSTNAERRSFVKKYDYDRDTEIFKDMKPKSFLLLDDLLCHTICNVVDKRYQEADMLIEKLNEIIEQVTPQKTETYIYWYETHLYTAESTSGAALKAKELVKLYSGQGYAGIIITDCLKNENTTVLRLKKENTWEQKVSRLLHGYEEAKKESIKLKQPLDVFLGWEFCTGNARFLTYGLRKDFLLANKDLDKLSIEEYSSLVRRNGGYIVQAHPYKDGKVPIYDLSLIDGMEVFNACASNDENKKAIEFSVKAHLPMQAGTSIPKTEQNSLNGIKLEKKAEKISDIISAMKNGTAELIIPDNQKQLTKGVVEPISDCFVKIFWDCQHAEDIARELSIYIQQKPHMSATYLNIEKFETEDEIGKTTKIIIIGHHRIVDSKWEALENIQPKIHQTDYFVKYAYKGNLCVITAAKHELEKSKKNMDEFEDAYWRLFKKQHIDTPLRRAQFEYIVEEFKENGLNDFLQ